MGVGAAIAACAAMAMLWDWLDPSPTIPRGGEFACFAAAAVALVAGAGIFYWGREHRKASLTRREALLAVALIWIGAGIFGGLPFVLGAGLSPADAFFEAVSGFTTTGATVITDIETRLSRSMLLWRSMTQWLGGMGIVVLFVAVFPSLGAGAKHMYRGEAPGAQADGFRPRIAETSLTLWKLYALLTLVEIVLLGTFGMDPFEAICHGLTTMSTGGFSTRDASVGGFGVPAFEYIISVFMLVGTVNYGLFYTMLRGRSLRVFMRDVEFRTYLFIVVLSVALFTLINLRVHPEIAESFRYALFMVATTISSTGYGTDDYTAYPQASLALLILLMFVGGCSGSTAGGIKVERIVIMAKQTLAQIHRSFEPTKVHIVRVGRTVLPKSILADVTSFFVIYMLCVGVGILAIVAIEGVPVGTAFGATLTCLSNMGPAPFHEAAGFADNFAAYSGVSKVLFSMAMLLGRLEFFTLFALLLPDFWRR